MKLSSVTFWTAILVTTPLSAQSFLRDISKTIEKSAHEVGKAIEKPATDISQELNKTLGNAGRLEVEQSPTNICRINPELEECKAALSPNLLGRQP